MIIFNTKLVCTNPQKLRQKLCTQCWNCQKTVQSTTTPNLHAIIITTTAEIRSSTSTWPPGHKCYQNGNRFEQWREWGGRQWVTNYFCGRRKTSNMRRALVFWKEKHEKDEKSRCLPKDCGKRPASQRASEGGWREASRSYKRERAGSFTGRSFDREGQRAVTVARPLDVVALWNRTPVSVTAHSCSLLFPFHNKKESQQWLSSPFDSTP